MKLLIAGGRDFTDYYYFDDQVKKAILLYGKISNTKSRVLIIDHSYSLLSSAAISFATLNGYSFSVTSDLSARELVSTCDCALIFADKHPTEWSRTDDLLSELQRTKTPYTFVKFKK